MKKFCLLFSLFTLIALACSAWEPCGADAQGNTANCEYQIDNQGTLTIRATGDDGNIGQWNQTSNRSPWYGKKFTNVIIEPTIKDLGYQAFSALQSDNPITIPHSITQISADAFKSVRAPEIIIPTSVTSIGSHAFCYSSIQKIDIPDSVTSIAAYAFMGANDLKDVIIPNSVTSIGLAAFSYCSNISSLTIGENTKLSKIFTYPNGDVIDLSKIKIYCTGNTDKCDANLEKAGYSELKSIGAISKKINGRTYIVDKNGNIVASSGHRTNKRIYTVEEAALVTLPQNNTFKIRYR